MLHTGTPREAKMMTRVHFVGSRDRRHNRKVLRTGQLLEVEEEKKILADSPAWKSG